MGSRNTDSKKRSIWKQKFRTWGMSEEEISLCLQQIAQRQRMKRAGTLYPTAPLCTRAEYVRLLRKHTSPNSDNPSLHLGEDYEPPSDKGYKPKKVDPLLNGVARATGETARAVKRKKGITKFEYDQRQAKGI